MALLIFRKGPAKGSRCPKLSFAAALFILIALTAAVTFPPSASMQGTSFNVWGQTRSSVKPRVRTYRIAGQVTDNFCGTGIKDVSVTLGGASTASALTDAYGNFSFPNLPEGNGYTITLAKSGYTFQPPNWSVSNLQFDSNFVSKTTVNPNPLPNIRGRVADATGKPIAGLKLNLDGYYYPRSEYTSGSGNYAFNCLEPALNYTITPVGASYTFTPPTQTFNNLTQTVAANFTSSPLPVTVSGHVIESGKPLKGLLVKLEGDRTAQMLTDDAGFYSFTIPADGLYSLTPSRDFYTFSPQNVSFSNLSGNQTYNFAGQKTTYSIEVYAKTPFDQSISGATVTLSGGATATTQTDASGYAVLRNLAPLGDYTVTVAKDGYTFDPPNKTWEFVFGDKGFIFRGTPPTTDGNCVTSLSPASAFAYFTGGSPSIHISAPTGCNWTATTSATWIRMPSGQSYGVGSRQFGVTAERNDSVSPRTGIVTIGGQTFTITQGGAKSETPNILWQSGGEAGGGKAVALSPDKQLLATSSEGTIKIWRYADGQLLKTFGALYTTTALQFTPDGQHLIAAGKWLPGQDPRTGTLRMYRVSDWQQERDFNPGATSGFNSFKFTPDGQYLVLGSETFTVQVLRVSDGARVGTFGPFNVRAVSVSPDGQYFAATGFDYWSQTPEARVWRMSDGALIKKLSGMTFISDSISYSPDGQYLAVGDWGGAGGRGTVWLWQTSDWTLARKFEGPFNSAVYTLAFSPDGLTLATAGSDAACTSCINQIYLWNVATGLPLGTIPALKGAVYQLLFSDNTTLYSRGAEHFAKVWQLPTGSLVRQFGTSRNWVTAASFSPDGQYIASTNAVDDDSTLWGAELRRASDGALVRTFLGHLDVINSLAFSPDGQTLATASGSASIDNRDSRIFLWDVGTGAQLRTLPGHGGGTTSLSYSSGGQLLASGGRDSLVKVWNPSSGTLLRSFTACDGNLAVNSIAFSPDGTLLATGGGDTRIRLWRTSDLTLVRTLAGNNYPVFSLAFSPDGQTLAVSSDSYGQHIQLWRTGDGALLRSFGATNAFSSHLAFSHDGRTLISSSTSMLWFWNVDDGDLLRTYGEDVGWTWPSALAVSPDGRQLGVGRYDQTIEVLNLPGVTVGDEIGPPGPGPVFFFLPPNPEPPPELETPPGRPIPQTQPPRPSAPTRRR